MFLDPPDGVSTEHKPRLLVLDGSRVVRVTLAKRLANDFDIVEEADGESAWQRLILDGRIAAVISGINPPRLNARDLLARLRGSAMQRLKIIPFVLIVSDLENPEGPKTGDWLPVTGYITKSMSKDAMSAQLNGLLNGTAVAAEKPSEVAPKESPERSGRKKDKHAESSCPGLMSQGEFDALLASLAFSPGENVCVLALGVDRLDELTSRFGKDIPEMLNERIAGLLATKLDPLYQQLGAYGNDRLAIVSHGADMRQASRFAKRVCKSLASGQIAIQGKKLSLTVSLGIAGTPDDKLESGRELLALASHRLDLALMCGGNLVCSEDRPGCPLHGTDKNLVGLIRALRPGGEIHGDQIGGLGLSVLPLLQRMNDELSLGLSLGEIKKQLQKRTKVRSGD